MHSRLTSSPFFASKASYTKGTAFCVLPDEPLGIPSDQPSRWLMLGAAMAIQECGTSTLDYFAMLRGWALCRQDVGSGKL